MKNLMRLTLMLFAASAFFSTPAKAADCGEKPTILPKIPVGAEATREEIRTARQEVIDFSNRIDTYLKCMDERVVRLGPYMTQDQRDRVAEDLNKLANVRTDIQVTINKEIRAWRQAQQSGR